MIYDPQYDTLLSLREAANHIKDGARVFCDLIICHGDKPVVLEIAPSLLLSKLESDPDQDADSQFLPTTKGICGWCSKLKIKYANYR